MDVLDVDDWICVTFTGEIDLVKTNIDKFKTQKGTAGDTALMLSAFENQQECVIFLSQFELNLKDNKNKTALMYAVDGNSVMCIPYLLGELKQQSEALQTALHIACLYDNEKCAKLLLEEFDMIDGEGRTPLQVAITHNSRKCIQLLEDFQRNPQPFLDQIKKAKEEAEKVLQAAQVDKQIEIQQEVIQQDLMLQHQPQIADQLSQPKIISIDEQIQKLKRSFDEMQQPLSQKLFQDAQMLITNQSRQGRELELQTEIKELRTMQKEQKTEIESLKKKQIEDNERLKNEKDKEILELITHLGAVQAKFIELMGKMSGNK